MRLPPELRRILGIHDDGLDEECPKDRVKRERLETQERRDSEALAHAERVIADVRRAVRLIEEHRW